jgi:hypothetical protein
LAFPTGVRTPVGIRICGSDLAEIERLGTEVEAALRDVPGTRSAFAERTAGGYFVDLDLRRDEIARSREYRRSREGAAFTTPLPAWTAAPLEDSRLDQCTTLLGVPRRRRASTSLSRRSPVTPWLCTRVRHWGQGFGGLEAELDAAGRVFPFVGPAHVSRGCPHYRSPLGPSAAALVELALRGTRTSRQSRGEVCAWSSSGRT